MPINPPLKKLATLFLSFSILLAPLTALASSYSYDPNGNLTTETKDNGETINYGYDAFNRLSTVTDKNGTTTYIYGEGDDIVMKILPDGKRHYYYGPTTEKDPDGNWIHYIYLDPINFTNLIAIEDKNGTHTVISDHLGSPSLILDAQGNIEQKIDYLPFGQESQNQILNPNPFPNTTPPTPFGFTGQRKNNDGSGLLHYGARFYHPALMRFTQPDPAVLHPDQKTLQNPQLLNEYSYALNNPVVNVDPNGKQAIPAAVAIGGYFVAMYGSTIAPMLPVFFDNARFSTEMLFRIAPAAGDATDLAESVLGRNTFTGEKLSSLDLYLTRASVAMPIISGALLRKIGKTDMAQGLVRTVREYKMSRIIKQAENGVEQIKVGSRGEAIEVGMKFVGESPVRIFSRETGLPTGWRNLDETRIFREPAPKGYFGGREGANLEIFTKNNLGEREKIVNTHLVW